MTIGIYEVVLSFHILLAITWVGGLLFVGWGVFPAVRILKFPQQQLFLLTLMKSVHWLFTLAGVGVIGTGVLLGTVLGPIKHWSQIWSTTFGNLWVTALIIGIVTLIWGILVGYKRAIHVLSNTTLWEAADKGDTKPLYKALLSLAAIESVEGFGFIALVYIMVLLP